MTRRQIMLVFYGVMLGMLLAGAVDLGRAYYTAVVVTNMAGEGAAYALCLRLFLSLRLRTLVVVAGAALAAEVRLVV